MTDYVVTFIKGIFVIIFSPLIAIWCAGWVFTEMVKEWKNENEKYYR